MSLARHNLYLLLLAVLGLSALSVRAQVFASNGSFVGLLNDELLPSGKLSLRTACLHASCPSQELGPDELTRQASILIEQKARAVNSYREKRPTAVSARLGQDCQILTIINDVMWSGLLPV